MMIGNDFFTYNEKLLVNVVDMEAGDEVPPHKHDYSHSCFVTKGTVRMSVGTIVHDLDAPSTMHFQHGAYHGFKAVTDSTVICVHETDKLPK